MPATKLPKKITNSQKDSSYKKTIQPLNEVSPKRDSQDNDDYKSPNNQSKSSNEKKYSKTPNRKVQNGNWAESKAQSKSKTPMSAKKPEIMGQ
mmetsp:Transcript_3115/g.2683  ORF Transcript_3115/g.2683 Transcript_3115/m.2683 type:complete len:93 (+) Transcript_3115:1666-1944(+)